MRRWDNANVAILELEKGEIEILNDEDLKEYDKLLAKTTGTKSEFLKELEKAEFSEFNQGIILGLLLAKEGGMTTIRRPRWKPW